MFKGKNKTPWYYLERYCGTWYLRIKSKSKKEKEVSWEHFKKYIGPMFGMSALISKAVYLQVNAHWMQTLLQSWYFLDLEVWDYVLLMILISKRPLHSAVLIDICPKHLFSYKKGDLSQERSETVALMFIMRPPS